VVVDHIDSNESNDDPGNLRWLCKACNTRLGIAAAKAGIGKRVDPKNPGAQTLANPKVVAREKAEAMHEKAIAFMDNIGSDDPNDIGGMSVEEYAEHKHLKLSNNPGAESLAQYVGAAVEHERGAHDAGGIVIHETPKEKRQSFAKEIWRRRRRSGK
jgi:hypothetical protein